MVELASDSQRSIKNYVLSRYACYLIVQNGDPRKESIALGQPISPSKPDGKRSRIRSINSMKTVGGW